MPATTITLTIPEGDVNKVVKALCRWAGTEPSGANAKAALIRWVRQQVDEQDQLDKQQAFAAGMTTTPPTIT